MASQLILHSGDLLQASASATTPALGVVALGLGTTVAAAIALRSLIFTLRALAGLAIEGLKIALIMLAAPVIVVLVLRSGHANSAQPAPGNHAATVAISDAPVLFTDDGAGGIRPIAGGSRG